MFVILGCHHSLSGLFHPRKAISRKTQLDRDMQLDIIQPYVCNRPKQTQKPNDTVKCLGLRSFEDVLLSL